MLKRALLTLAALVCLGLAGMEAYTRAPSRLPVQALDLDGETTRRVVLIFHGAQDGGNPILEEIADRYRQFGQLSPGTVVVNYRWDEGADNRLRSSANARRLGRMLGTELASLPELQSVRLIAHSAGAFVPDALCRQLRAEGAAARVEMTFLDPFGINGFMDWRYGVRNHGACANYAAAFINTDDPAPASNSMLAQAHNHDVTNSPGRGDFRRNGHYWPLRYYADFIDVAEASPAIRTHEDYPRGSVRPPLSQPESGRL